MGTAAAAPPGDITAYRVPNGGDLHGIAAGPDGNMWFTNSSGNSIGRITPSGTVTEYRLPTAYSSPENIAAGPDGNMWFTEGNRIGRITPTGVITEYPTGGVAFAIAAGPDGNMWFTNSTQFTHNIARITPAGTITEYPIPTPQSNPMGIAAGPDGNMWFTESAANKIGRITPDGAITEFAVPTAASQLRGIAAGPDGNLWFPEPVGQRIGRITPDGAITEYPTPTPSSYPFAIAAGPDGNMWFTDTYGIGRITPAAPSPHTPCPTSTASSQGIAAGPDGYMWITQGWGLIGRISPTATPMTVKKTCPVNVTLHKPTPKTVGNRILTDTITTNTSTCVLPKPVVLCRPLASTTAGEKAFCDTKVTKRGKIRVNTQGYQAVRVTVIVRAQPKRGHANSWKPNTWRKPWILREPAVATNKGETDLTLSKGLVQGMDAAGVGIKAIRGATLSKSRVVTFQVKSVKGDVITHKGALLFSSSTGFVTLQNIALNYTTGKASAFVEATAVPTGMQITDVLTFTGGKNQIKQNGTWKNAKVALATSTSVGNPAPLFASQLGLPAGSIATGMTIGKASDHAEEVGGSRRHSLPGESPSVSLLTATGYRGPDRDSPAHVAFTATPEDHPSAPPTGHLGEIQRPCVSSRLHRPTGSGCDRIMVQVRAQIRGGEERRPHAWCSARLTDCVARSRQYWHALAADSLGAV